MAEEGRSSEKRKIASPTYSLPNHHEVSRSSILLLGDGNSKLISMGVIGDGER